MRARAVPIAVSCDWVRRSPSCSRSAVVLGGASLAAAECVAEGPTGSHCLYRSLLPSTGIVAVCRDDRDCRVGYYYGDPAKADVDRAARRGWRPCPSPR